MKAHWCTVDPGDTTGFAVWKGEALVFAYQEPMWSFIDRLDEWAKVGLSPWPELWPQDANQALRAVVCEDWQLYPDIAKSGALDYNRQHTVRGIGAIELIARQSGLSIFFQGAAIKEMAEAAGSRELYLSPQHENRHANDAIDHGVFRINAKGVPC